MATKIAVQNLTATCLAYSNKKMTQQEKQALEDGYFAAFRSCNDIELAEALNLYLEDGEYFPPKPKDILSGIKNKPTQRHTRELIELYTCKQCHQKVSAITDGICLDCAGIPRLETNKVKLQDPEDRDYRIEGRIKCQECGKITMCIKEPIKTGPWRCRECYSGLTKKEIVDRFSELKLFSGDRDHIFKWIQDAPF